MITTPTTIPAPTTEAFGFWGTMNEHAEAAWPLAMHAIAEATDLPLEAVRAFLDSRHGRHFADSVLNGLFYGATLEDAITSATRQWMTWTISRRTARESGIPAGLPYLTGWVIQAEILDQESAD
jgi:hypothetical protein